MLRSQILPLLDLLPTSLATVEKESFTTATRRGKSQLLRIQMAGNLKIQLMEDSLG